MSATLGAEGIFEGSTVSVDQLSYEYVSGVLKANANKLFNPETDETATERLIDLRESWRHSYVVTVFTSGVYDVTHLNHAGYLLHTRATGAALLYESEIGGWNNLSEEAQQHFTSRMLSRPALRQIVSVDGDRSVSVRKGGKPEKGNSVRPIYSWETRALLVAGLSYPDPFHSQRLVPTVDAVTVHGPDDFPTGHIHAQHFDLVAALRPDVWAIYGESTDILEAAPLMESLGGIALRMIRDGDGCHYHEDEFVGDMSTTGIIKRATGGQ